MDSEHNNIIIDPDDGDITLHLAALTGDCVTVREFLKTDTGKELINATVRPFKATALRLACTAGNVECVRELLKQGADVDLADIKKQTPLFVAITKGHIGCCKLLLQAGANPSGNIGNLVTPLHIACCNGFAPAVQLLLQYGARMDGTHTHPLHVAAAADHMNCFIMLLLNGAETDLEEYSTHRPSLVQVLSNKKHDPLFLKLWVLFGGSLWDRKGSEQNVTEVEEGPLSELLHILKGTPLSLQCLCRIQIWKSMQRNVVPRLSLLDLPRTLINFLAYRDIPVVWFCVHLVQGILEDH